jgi:hypothetical protein
LHLVLVARWFLVETKDAQGGAMSESLSAASGTGLTRPTRATLSKFTILTRLVIAALILCAVLDALAVASDFSYQNLIDRIVAGDSVAPSDAQSADDRQHLIGFGQIGIFLVTAAVFIVWFRKAYTNVARLGISGLRWSPGWAVFAWFVPLLNLVRPKAIANDIWLGSDPHLPPNAALNMGTPLGSVPWFHTAWWGAFVLSFLVGHAAFGNWEDAQTASELSSANNIQTFADVIDLVAAILAIAVVSRTANRQRERAIVLARGSRKRRKVAAKTRDRRSTR